MSLGNKRLTRVFALFVCIVLLVSISFEIAISEDLQEPPPTKPIKREEANPKLQTLLQEAQKQAQRSLAQARDFARAKGIPMEDSRVKVIIEPREGRSSNVDLSKLKGLGATVEAVSKSLVRASVPLARLEEITDKVKGIGFIRLPREPKALKVDTSEGVEKTGATDYHDVGFYGQEVDVGIIDLGFDHLTEAKDSGDIPPEAISSEHDYTSDNNLESGVNHGTDVAEIVHDMAPEAQLHLMKVGDSVDLENAKDDALAMELDVINHSLGWFNYSYYDGTGQISNIAADAYDHGTIWINSAGNYAQTHWKGEFYDTDDDSWGEFSGGDECNGLGQVNSEEIISIYMTWNAWPSDAEDYDLYLLDGQGDTVASSTGIQGGSQPPTESISYYVNADDNFCIAIYKDDAPSEPELEVFVNFQKNRPDLEYLLEQSSTIDPANDEKVVAVGAISQFDWESGPLEDFSSRGPTNDSKYASPRIKPDLMGPDAVSTSGYGTFSGTSASSPHVAGAAALLLSADPTLTAENLRDNLQSGAIDMGDPGKDNYYGWGRIDMSLDSETVEAEFPGWNLVSVPLEPENPDPLEVFSGMNNPYEIYHWDSSSNNGDGGYLTPTTGYDTVQALEGSWLYMDDDEVPKPFQIKGHHEEDREIILPNAGWYQIGVQVQYNWGDIGVKQGSDGETMTVDEQAGEPGDPHWLSKFIWKWDNSTGEYLAYEAGADQFTLEPGTGYWVRSRVDDLKLVVPFEEPVPSSNIIEAEGTPFSELSNEEAISPPPKPPSGLESPGSSLFAVQAGPNPAKSGRVTFSASGVGIRRVKVMLYDLSGQEIFSSPFKTGNEITWNLRDQAGRLIANGVYLYKMKVEGISGVETSEVKKLLVVS